MTRKLIAPLFGAVLALGIAIGPAATAGASQNWEPANKPKSESIYIEPDIPTEDANAIQTSYEVTLGSKKTSTYTYVAKVPETWDTETAARAIVSKWKLNRSTDSLILYDALGKKAFIWPNVEENRDVTSKLPTTLDASTFAKKLTSIYKPALQYEKAESVVNVGKTVIAIALPLVILAAIVAMFGQMITRGY